VESIDHAGYTCRQQRQVWLGLEQCARGFARALAHQYTPKTVRKYTLSDFVCWDTDGRHKD